jgi:Phosphodiester glycosidase
VVGVLRKAAVLAALAAVVLPQPAAGGRTSEQIMPKIRYINETRLIGGQRVVFHVVYAPKPGGLYGLRPVLSSNTVSGRQTLSAMQRHMLPKSNVVGVNADFFTYATGHPNGLLVQEGVLESRPLSGRSAVGIGLDGLLRFARIDYAGDFHVDGFGGHRLKEYNRPTWADNGFTLFSSKWGAHTPHRSYTTEAILTNVRRTFPNVDRTGTILKIVRGSEHAIPAGGAVLQARGTARAMLRAEAVPGLGLTFRLGLTGWWDGVEDAVGGGPRLVRNGEPVLQPNEWFTSTQLVPRAPRTAVGQLAGGRLVLVAADGRSRASAGVTNAQMARAMVHYGAVDAMAFDSGGSTEMAFNAHVLNHPSDGVERLLADSLQVTYIGVYTRKPRWKTFSPNGDGFRDTQTLYAKLVRPSTVDIKLYKPNGDVGWSLVGSRSPGTRKKYMSRPGLREGTWRWIANAVDSQGRSSRMERRFRVNKTLGYVTLSKSVMPVRRHRGGRQRVGFRLTHTAYVRVTISRRHGRVVRTLVTRRSLGPGGYAVIWNGRNDAGSVVRGGRYVATVDASNTLGQIAQPKRFRVRRVS